MHGCKHKGAGSCGMALVGRVPVESVSRWQAPYGKGITVVEGVETPCQGVSMLMHRND